MKGSRWIWMLCAAALLPLAACKVPTSQQPPSSNVTAESNREAGCKVFVDDNLEDEFARANDPFAAKVLKKGSCEGHSFQAVDKMLRDRGCKLDGRSFVSEEGQFHNTNNGRQVLARGIDVWSCDGSGHENKVYVVNFGGQPQARGFEIIGFDKSNRALMFYTQTRGPDGDADFVFNGTSFDQAQETRGMAGSHPCTDCHANGGLLMKELRFPWISWHTPIIGMADLQAMKDNTTHDDLPERPTVIGEDIEILTLKTAIDINKERIKRLQEGKEVRFPHESGTRTHTLHDLMEPVFCEREINLATSTKTRISSAPRDLFLNRLLMPLEGSAKALGLGGVENANPKILTLSINGTQSDSRLDANGFSDNSDFASLSVDRGETALTAALRFQEPSVDHDAMVGFYEEEGITVAAAGDATGDKRFGQAPFVIPARSFSDDDFVARLVDSGVIEEKLAVAALMVDFPNPVFSPVRCNLLDEIPKEPVADQDAASITASVKKAMEGSDAAGAKAFVANLETSKKEHAKTVKAYLEKCSNGGVTQSPKDFYKVMRAKRVRLLEEAEKFAIESFSLPIFPEVKRSARSFVDRFEDQRNFGLNEECQLEERSAQL